MNKGRKKAAGSFHPFQLRESSVRILSWALLSAGVLGLVFDWLVFQVVNPGYGTAVATAILLIGYRFGRHLAVHERIPSAPARKSSAPAPNVTLLQGLIIVSVCLAAVCLTAVSFLHAPQYFVLLVGACIALLLFTVWRRGSLNWALLATAVLLMFLITVARSYPPDSGYPVTRLMAFLVSASLAVATMFVVSMRTKDRANRASSRAALAGAAAAYLLAWVGLADVPMAEAWRVGSLSLIVLTGLLALAAWGAARPRSATRFLVGLSGGLALVHCYLFWDSLSIATGWLALGLAGLTASVLAHSQVLRLAGGAALGMAYVSYMVSVAAGTQTESVVWWQQPTVWLGTLLFAALPAAWSVYRLADHTAVEERLRDTLRRGLAVVMGSIVAVIWLSITDGTLALGGLLVLGAISAVAGWRAERMTYLAPAALLTGYVAVQILALDAAAEGTRLLAFLSLAILVLLVVSFIHSQTQRLKL